MSGVRVIGLTKRFGDVVALDDVSLEVRRGEFVCILGPTNAGKSTLLKTIAGLHRPDDGTVEIEGRDVTALEPRERRVSLLFQNIALFPTLSAFDNIAFPLRAARRSGDEIDARTRDIARLLSVDHLLDRLPRTFSGGEQQRVAIGRAIAQPGDALLLDEPLTNLDARIRIALRIEFKKLHQGGDQTIIYVTHDQVEAMSLADRIAVLHHGRLQQIGTPDEVYDRPANRFVARFIGTPPMNILDARIETEDGMPWLVGDGFRIDASPLRSASLFARLPQEISFGVRPEDVRVAPTASEAAPIAADIIWIERLGAKSVLDVQLGRATVKTVVPADHPAAAQGRVWLGITPQPQHLLDRTTGVFFA